MTENGAQLLVISFLGQPCFDSFCFLPLHKPIARFLYSFVTIWAEKYYSMDHHSNC